MTAPVVVGLVAAGAVLLVLSFAATSDWLRLAEARRLTGEAAAAAALAAAKGGDAAAAARAVAGPDAEVVAEWGTARPGPSGLAFQSGAGEVTRVTVSTTGRSLLGTPFGLGLRTITAAALARRSGVAALVERSTAVPVLTAVPAAIEARLFGPSGALTPDERARLGAATFTVADLAAELGRTLAARDGGTDIGVTAVSGASFKASELMAALAALYRGAARRSADAASVLAIVDRLATAAGETEEMPLPLSGVLSLAGSDADLTLAAPLRPLEFLQAVIRARLAASPATVDLAAPAIGIDAVTLTLASDGAAAAVLIGGEDGLVGIPGIRIAARFTVSGLAIPGVASIELPLDMALGAGDARIKTIACGPSGAEVTVTGRPVRAGVAIAAADGTASPAGASDYARLLAAGGVTAWGRGRSAFADDPPVEIVFRPDGADTIASLRAPIDFSNRLERLAAETQILVSLDGTARDTMTEAGVRDEIARLIVGAIRPIDGVLSSTFATLGVVPGRMDVVAAGASCNGATLLGEAK